MDKNNIEAIFVDDCSTDESVNIIKHYEKDYDFIKLIQLPENTGSPSEPRNIGMRHKVNILRYLMQMIGQIRKDSSSD